MEYNGGLTGALRVSSSLMPGSGPCWCGGRLIVARGPAGGGGRLEDVEDKDGAAVQIECAGPPKIDDDQEIIIFGCVPGQRRANVSPAVPIYGHRRPAPVAPITPGKQNVTNAAYPVYES